MTAPILEDKDYVEPSEFTPESLLREARRQKALPNAEVRRSGDRQIHAGASPGVTMSCMRTRRHVPWTIAGVILASIVVSIIVATASRSPDLGRGTDERPSFGGSQHPIDPSFGQFAAFDSASQIEVYRLPDSSARSAGVLSPGEQAFLTSDVRTLGSEAWVSVQLADGDRPLFGWILMNQTGVTLRPAAGPACDPRPNVLWLVTLSPAERLWCYRSRELTLGPAILQKDPNASQGFGGTPEWLVGPATTRLWGELGIDSPGGSLPIRSQFATLDAKPGWSKITGHFNDPAADDCAVDISDQPSDLSASQQVLWCREQFVIVAIGSTTPPSAPHESPPPARGGEGY